MATHRAPLYARQYQGKTPLHLAAWYGRKEITETLIASGAELNSKNANGWTPLHIATEADMFQLAELLVKEGADILEKDTNGKNPLDLAISLKRTSIANLYRKQLIPDPPSTSEPTLRLVLERSNISISLDTIVEFILKKSKKLIQNKSCKSNYYYCNKYIFKR